MFDFHIYKVTPIIGHATLSSQQSLSNANKVKMNKERKSSKPEETSDMVYLQNFIARILISRRIMRETGMIVMTMTPIATTIPTMRTSPIWSQWETLILLPRMTGANLTEGIFRLEDIFM